MIGHRSRFGENDDLPLWHGPVVKKKPPFSNARVLYTRKVMRSRDAQCNTGVSHGFFFISYFGHVQNCLFKIKGNLKIVY